MADLVANRHRSTYAGESLGVIRWPVAGGVHIYKSAVLGLLNGYLVIGGDVAGLSNPCVALEEVDNSVGADGDATCLVNRVAASVTVQGAPAPGVKVNVLDGDTMTTAATTNNISGGMILRADNNVPGDYIVAFKESL